MGTADGTKSNRLPVIKNSDVVAKVAIDQKPLRVKLSSRRTNELFLLLRTVFVETVFCLVISVCILTVSAHREQKFAIEPQDQSAVVGSRVTLPCRVVNKVGQLQWTKDDFGLGAHRHLTGYDRYKMIGSDEEGDYSLDIRDVTLEDDALYQCQVSSGPRGEPPIRSRYARLTVLMPPDPPKILQGPVFQAVEDSEINLECVSVGGTPAAEITWVDNEGGVLTQGVTYTAEPMTDARRYTARSILHLRPRRHHHNHTFTCQAQNTADRAYRSSAVKLQILYAPKVRVFLKTGLIKGRIQESDTLVMSCQATANPKNLTYRWYVNNEQISADKSELIISNVSRKYNEAMIKCEVQNAIGKSADTKSIEIAYGPTFKRRPKNVEAESGSIATLTCEVDGHPAPKILWLRYENDRVIRMGKSPNLTVLATSQTAGQYWCRATIEHHQDIEAPASIFVRGPPKIISNNTQYGTEGDSVRVECVSFSVPKPDFIMWSFEGREINAFPNQEYVFLEETLADHMTKSSLVISKSEARHFGSYNCTVINTYGMETIEIKLIADKTNSLILIVSGISSAAILVLVVMLVVMLCYRKAKCGDIKKPDITDIGKTCVDQFKDADAHSNISDLKLELRQVEGSCDMDISNGGSETDLHPTLHLTSNLGLPLAGPVSMPAGYENELMKQYQRYSGDFNQAINSLQLKTQGQSNGYVPYVDYNRDYAPPLPSNDSLTGSLIRSTEGSYPIQYGSLHRQSSCGRLPGVGPDVIPMDPGVMFTGGVDVRYAATYGNPYLRGSASSSYAQQVHTNQKAPPPYYAVRNPNLHVAVNSSSSPSSSSSSRPVTSPLASSSSTTSGAQPQVPKLSMQSSGSLYVMPPSNQTNLQATQITSKGNGKAGTHV